jgi:hypothetical protein
LTRHGQDGRETGYIEHLLYGVVEAADLQVAARRLEFLCCCQQHSQPGAADVFQRRKIDKNLAGTAFDQRVNRSFRFRRRIRVKVPLNFENADIPSFSRLNFHLYSCA